MLKKPKSKSDAPIHTVASIADEDEEIELLRELAAAMDAELPVARNDSASPLTAAHLKALAEAMDAASDTRFAQSQFRRERKKRRG